MSKTDEKRIAEDGKVNPAAGKEQPQQANLALQRLIRTLTGEDRRWQPKGTPSKSHLLGRMFRDYVLPWAINEYGYWKNRRKEKEAQEAIIQENRNKGLARLYNGSYNPPVLSPEDAKKEWNGGEGINYNAGMLQGLLDTEPIPKPETSELGKMNKYDPNREEILEGLNSGDRSYLAVGPPPLTDEDYDRGLARTKVAINTNPTAPLNPPNPHTAIGNLLLSETEVNQLVNEPFEKERVLEYINKVGDREDELLKFLNEQWYHPK